MTSPHFPNKTLEKMRNSGISENDALDTYNSGEHSTTSTGSHMMIKRYPSYGYEIGLYYVLDNFSNRNVITHVWKRKII